MELTTILVAAMLAAAPLMAYDKGVEPLSGPEDIHVSDMSAKPKRQYSEITFSVPMHCKSCADKIRENISFEKGVKDMEISLENNTVWIRYDQSKTDESRLAEAFRSLGYEVKKVS